MRLPSLDGIRAISIALVVMVHTADSRGITQYGNFGVNIFFVLSGFLITWLLCCEERKTGRISVTSFYQRRALRILPPALVYLLVVSVIFRPRWADILHCLLFFRNVTDGPIYTMHFWSLSIEEQFYLFWPSVFLLLRSNGRRLLFAFLLLALIPVWIQITFKFGHGMLLTPRPRFDLRCDPIIVGCCLALLRNDERFARLIRNDIVQSWWIVSIGIASLAFTVTGHAPAAIAGVLSSIAVAAFLNYVVERSGGFLNHPALIWIGQLSYSLYIWQQLFCCKPQVGRLGQFPQNVILALAAASISYYFIERPVLSFRVRRFRTLAAEGPAIAVPEAIG